MYRCVNDYWLYCLADPDVTEHTIREQLLGYDLDHNPIYGVELACKLDPKTCPKAELLSNLVALFKHEHPSRTPPTLKPPRK